MNKKPKALLLSAYDAQSHRYWRQGLVNAFPQWQWQQLVLPGRYFSWRTRGNSLTWGFSDASLLQQPYDFLVATSMTDLSALRGFVPALAQLPTLVYFHENQFAYPVSDHARRDISPSITSLYTALCADLIAFNSAYNRDTFLNGVEGLLKQLPDHIPKGLLEQLRQRSCLLPVPLMDEALNAVHRPESQCTSDPKVDWKIDAHRRLNIHSSSTSSVCKLLWAARWEYDKGPNLLLEIVKQLNTSGRDYRLCVLGQQFRQTPPVFEHIKQCAGERLVQWAYEPDYQLYRDWLASADVVLSTAEHEFQGIAVQEAIAAGCQPLLPKRLAYPEWVTGDSLYDVDGLTTEQQAANALSRLHALTQQNRQKPTAIDPSQWSWSKQKSNYMAAFERLLNL